MERFYFANELLAFLKSVPIWPAKPSSSRQLFDSWRKIFLIDVGGVCIEDPDWQVNFHYL
jgi:hypothetical protein